MQKVMQKKSFESSAKTFRRQNFLIILEVIFDKQYLDSSDEERGIHQHKNLHNEKARD